MQCLRPGSAPEDEATTSADLNKMVNGLNARYAREGGERCTILSFFLSSFLPSTFLFFTSSVNYLIPLIYIEYFFFSIIVSLLTSINLPLPQSLSQSFLTPTPLYFFKQFQFTLCGRYMCTTRVGRLRGSPFPVFESESGTVACC